MKEAENRAMEKEGYSTALGMVIIPPAAGQDDKNYGASVSPSAK